MRRVFGMALIAALIPAFALGQVSSSLVVLDKAIYKDDACAEEQGGDMSCLCDTDVTYLKLAGGAHASSINAFLKHEAELAIRDDAGKPFCAGRKIDPTAVDRNENMTSLQYDQVLQYQNDDLLAFSLNFWSYWEGAAHGNGASKFHTFDRATGRELRLGDMIDASQLAAINRHIHETLKTMPESFIGAQLADGAKVNDVADRYLKGEAAEAQALSVDAHGVSVYFAPYAVGPYSSGDIYVHLPERFVRHPALRKLYGKKS